MREPKVKKEDRKGRAKAKFTKVEKKKKEVNRRKI